MSEPFDLKTVAPKTAIPLAFQASAILAAGQMQITRSLEIALLNMMKGDNEGVLRQVAEITKQIDDMEPYRQQLWDLAQATKNAD